MRHCCAAIVAAGCAVTALSSPSAAQQMAPKSQKFIVQAQDTSTFGGLPVLPTCLSFAVQRGNPNTGPSVLLIKMTAGCMVPWHWHTAREELMMVSGQGTIDFPEASGQSVRPGGYVLLPAEHHHEFSCKTDCTFFDAIGGKFDIHYVDDSGAEIAVAQALAAVDERAAPQQE